MKKATKKILVLILCGIIILLCTSCNTSTSSEINESDTKYSATAVETTSDENVIEEYEVEPDPPQLSNDCDRILASGYDKDDNYYQLVANETEDYDGTKIEIGVIKNNEWSIPLTNKSPFIGKKGLLSRNSSSIYDEKFAKFYYIGAGCFCYNNDIWNGDNGKVFQRFQNDGYYPVIDESVINNDGLCLLRKFPDDNFKLLNTKTMEITTINLVEEDDSVFPYSEGLFARIDRTFNLERNGFYNAQGKKVIDLSKYNLARDVIHGLPQTLAFIDGKCTFKIVNDQGTVYAITIDKKGEVIDSYKSEY